MNIQNLLSKYIQQSLISTNIKCFLHLITVQQSTHPKFGDYQINGLITISNILSIPIKNLAEKIIMLIKLNDIIEIIKFEQPGFINIFLKLKWIEDKINHISYISNLGVTMPKNPKTIIIDYSSPNIAKEMHVGHLRSTIIGDSVVRILSFLKHKVIRVNHIGDWGTQFGMLIAYIKTNKLHNFLFNKTLKLSVLEHFYREAKKKYDTNPVFAELSRNYVVRLQKGDNDCHQIWQYLVNISILNNQKLYTRLNITLKKSDIMGESTYRNMLPDIITDLKNKKLAVISNNATVVFIDHPNTNTHQPPFGVIIQKKDGGYLYSTTDIACIKYRCEILKADRIIYYIDSRQKQHLMHAWIIANKAGYIPQSVSLEHHICGMLLGNNKKPFKTRSGNALKLITLLDEALERARLLIHNKNPNLKYNQINKLAHIISIGAIKYAELSKNRTTNYVFNWNNMLNFEGNTAPYIQYAYARIFSIFKRFTQLNLQDKNYNIQLHTKEEKSLAVCLLQFDEIIFIVADRGTPHFLCAYLYKVATLFSTFYENCPILSINNISLQYSRLKLVLITARILKKGLNLLGIKTTKYM